MESFFLTEISKHWSFEPVNLLHVQDGYELTLDDMAVNRSDVAMCGNWIHVDLNRKYDCSVFFDYVCGTFLVPKPVIVNDAGHILQSLTEWVLISVMTTFVLTGISLIVADRLERLVRGSRDLPKLVYGNWTRAYFDLMAISLMQSIGRMEKPVSIKYILTG